MSFANNTNHVVYDICPSQLGVLTNVLYDKFGTEHIDADLHICHIPGASY